MATLLAMVQEIAALHAQVPPPGLVASTDATALQYLAVAKQTIDDLEVYGWPVSERRVLWTPLPAMDQGVLVNLFGTDLLDFDNNTFYDVTGQKPILGPVSAELWQQMISIPATAPEYSYRVYNNRLYIWPAPSAGRLFAVMMKGRTLVKDSDGFALPNFQADEDEVRIPEPVFKAWFTWKWLKARGEPWAAEYQRAQALLGFHLSALAGKPTLSLDNTVSPARPGILVPAGSWPHV